MRGQELHALLQVLTHGRHTHWHHYFFARFLLPFKSFLMLYVLFGLLVTSNNTFRKIFQVAFSVMTVSSEHITVLVKLRFCLLCFSPYYLATVNFLPA